MTDLLSIGSAAALAALAVAPAVAQPMPLGTYAGAIQASTSNGRSISGVPLANIPEYVLALITTASGSGVCTLTTNEIRNLAANQTRGLSASEDLGCMESAQGTYDYCDSTNQVLCEISNASTLGYIFDYDGHLHLDLEGHPHPQRFTFGVQFGAHTPSWVTNTGNGIEGLGVPEAQLNFGNGAGGCPTYGFPFFWDGAQLPSVSFTKSGSTVSLVGGTAPFPTTMYGIDLDIYLSAINYFLTHDFLTSTGADSGVPMYANFDGLRNAIPTLKQDDEWGQYQDSCTNPGTLIGSVVGSTVNLSIGVQNTQTYINVTSFTGPPLVKTDWITINSGFQSLTFCNGTIGGYTCGTGGAGIYPVSKFYAATQSGTFNISVNVSVSTPAQGAQVWYSAGLDATATGYVAGNSLVEVSTPSVLAVGDRVIGPGMQPERITGGAAPNWTVDVPQTYGSASNLVTLSAGQDLQCGKDVALAATRSIVDLVAMQTAAGTNSLGIVPHVSISPTTSNTADWPQEGQDCEPSATTVKPPVNMWELALFPALFPTNNCSLGWYGTSCGLGLASKVDIRMGGGSLCIAGTGCGNGANIYTLRLNAIGANVFDQTNAGAAIPCPTEGNKYNNNDPYAATYPGLMAAVAFQNMELPRPTLEVRNEWHPADAGVPGCVSNAWVGTAFLQQPAVFFPNCQISALPLIAGQVCNSAGALTLFGGAASTVTAYKSCQSQQDGTPCYDLQGQIALAGGVATNLTPFGPCSGAASGSECYDLNADVRIKQ